MLRVEARTLVGDLSLDVALQTDAGQCLALVGPSGAGKSTVLRIAAGLHRPERGTVTCGEDRWLDTAAAVNLPPEQRHCGYVFQDYALFEHLSAWQNVAYGLRGLPRAQRRARAHELLERFGLSARADARPRTLSGGERQRVALARTIAPGPRALLLDEPLSALDPRTRAAASRELRTVLRDAAVPAILVTHDYAEAAAFGDRVAVLDAGRIAQEGTPAQLAATPSSPFVADFTGAVVLTGSARRETGVTVVDLDGGGTVTSTDDATGPVAASVFPWEITLEPTTGTSAVPSGPGSTSGTSAVASGPGPTTARNRLAATIVSVTVAGGRARVGLTAGQPLVAEISEASATELALRPGTEVVATWKAAATRLVLA